MRTRWPVLKADQYTPAYSRFIRGSAWIPKTQFALVVHVDWARENLFLNFGCLKEPLSRCFRHYDENRDGISAFMADPRTMWCNAPLIWKRHLKYPTSSASLTIGKKNGSRLSFTQVNLVFKDGSVPYSFWSRSEALSGFSIDECGKMSTVCRLVDEVCNL